MSRAKTSLAALAFALTGVTACATAPDPDAEANAQLQAAMEEALKPATPEEIEAANNADPLTKANFWAKEYSKNAENLDNALTFAGGTVLKGVLTLEMKINYTRPGVGERLIARAEVLSFGRTQAVCHCKIYAVKDGNEKLCAAAQGTIVSAQSQIEAQTGKPLP